MAIASMHLHTVVWGHWVPWGHCSPSSQMTGPPAACCLVWESKACCLPGKLSFWSLLYFAEHSPCQWGRDCCVRASQLRGWVRQSGGLKDRKETLLTVCTPVGRGCLSGNLYFPKNFPFGRLSSLCTLTARDPQSVPVFPLWQSCRRESTPVSTGTLHLGVALLFVMGSHVPSRI